MNPFLRPSWRFERVLRLVDRLPVPGRTTRKDDRYIREFRAFLLKYRRGGVWRERLEEEQPEILWAYEMFQDQTLQPEARFLVEARLLSKQPLDDIADETKLTAGVVLWYEKLFFNVLPYIDCHDWIIRNIILPASDRMAVLQQAAAEPAPAPRATPSLINPHYDMTLKLFSYFGGPLLCEFMISGFRRDLSVHSREDCRPYLNNTFMGMIERASTQAARVVDVNKYNVMDLFAIHTRIMEIQQKVESEEGRHSQVESHIRGMLDELPWTVGREGRELYAGTVVGLHDEHAAELTDEELMLQGSGEQVDLKDVKTLSFQAATTKDGDHEKPHGGG